MKKYQPKTATEASILYFAGHPSQEQRYERLSLKSKLIVILKAMRIRKDMDRIIEQRNEYLRFLIK